MIRHIFKFIWNERKTNSWIVLEYVLVFCILWFCCDYLFYIGKSYYEPLGFDIRNTYSVRMTTLPSTSGDDKPTEDENYSYTMSIVEKIKRYPGVEHATICYGDEPYSYSNSWYTFAINDDTINQSFQAREVSSEFFDVFKIKLTKGEVFDWTDPASEKKILVSPDRNGYFGDRNKSAYPISAVHSLSVYDSYDENDDTKYNVIGVTKSIKSRFLSQYTSTIFFSLKNRTDLYPHEFMIRIHPNAAKGFEERFIKDMKNQLAVGPYVFSNITSLIEKEKNVTKSFGITSNLNSVYSITLFLIINIFLGIIGTFWYRTESRKSEIGLRIALGSSKRKVKRFLYTETIILLFISAIIGVNLCINIGQTDLLKALGIPLANHEHIGAGIEQYFINFGFTFLFLVIISLLAVWYPARQSSNLHPAEALHEE